MKKKELYALSMALTIGLVAPTKRSEESSFLSAKGKRNRRRLEDPSSSIPVRRPRIHGGWDAVEDRYSYAQVNLKWREKGHQCGGSLIAPDFVLTAAHCVDTFDAIEIGKYEKLNVLDKSESFVSVLEEIHPGYNEETTRFDVMLVQLNGTSTMATPIRINQNSLVPKDGDMLTVIGFGYNADYELPGVLQETDVEYDVNEQCDDIVDENDITLDGDLYPDMMCAGSQGRDSCYGDSGSPLVIKGKTEAEDVQVGLVSWGYECAGTLPGVYSRLSHWENYAFIEQTVCQKSIKPPDYMDCDRWTLPPTASPTTIVPTTSPTVTAAPTTYMKSEPPTSSRLKDYLDFVLPPLGPDVEPRTSGVTEQDAISAAVYHGSSSHAKVAVAMFIGATWACLLW
jgi:hypothetical protein